MITLKIDVTKINKAKLYKGEKGTYLNCTMIETPTSQYGDYMIVEETTREERESGVKGVILGNAKIIKPKVEQTVAQPAPIQSVQQQFNNESVQGGGDQLPF